ncbi:hypothetical protein KQX54_016725 [Cotesia glomerata]|uniref:Uncharacterized protein n=1 Tax=Cotesia glomerata TaxID=32391 RepID=A0AAV7I3T4_COTGL|nr:hypothetical protein KQX54_016725 [Cotesia glomerata]
MESVKPKETVNTVFLVDNNGFLTLADENNIEKFPTFIEGHPLNIASTLNDNNQSQPSTSSAHCSSAPSKSLQIFSRYGTVKATLLNHPQGSGILKSTKNSWNEENRKALDGTNLEQFARDIRAKSKKNVQPYLVTVASQSSSAITFINGDGWFLNVPDNGNSAISFDLLYKIFYVFNLDYPDSLRNFYNFMDFYIYDMDVKPFNIVSSVHVNITNVNT